MADSPYERVKGGRLTFKGGALATHSKTIDKNNKKKKKKTKVHQELQPDNVVDNQATGSGPNEGEAIYTIDAAKKMKYEELFPVETKKFGYDPKAKVKSVEDALDDRIKKKADRYCK
ncbi:hypothetical protein RND81_08G011800 [Saponaria officinalis]|uniref:Uncharacterized protein n=1 Tax=Saponaria officinalis TaxID=3572 RepID=A0AAW1J1X2_SAPOF